jgi:hypothetical protein
LIVCQVINGGEGSDDRNAAQRIAAGLLTQLLLSVYTDNDKPLSLPTETAAAGGEQVTHVCVCVALAVHASRCYEDASAHEPGEVQGACERLQLEGSLFMLPLLIEFLESVAHDSTQAVAFEVLINLSALARRQVTHRTPPQIWVGLIACNSALCNCEWGIGK